MPSLLRVLSSLSAMVFLAGCPTLREGWYACPDLDCPDGWHCHPDGLCRSTPPDGSLDASVDAAPDAPADALVDAPIDAPVADAGDGGDAGQCGGETVDLLVVVDNSNSMFEEQAQLATAFPDLIRALATGQPEPGGPTRFRPVTDLHVGVVSTDLGAGGFIIPTCEGRGDDGVLVTDVRSTDSGCGATLPSFLSFDDSGLSQFRSDFACKATLGLSGCGFEQQLEAMLKAITPSTSALRFVDGTSGHADGANAGFLRPGSVLVVVIVSDEEDCSALDPRLFQPSDGPYPGNLNERCTTYHGTPGVLHAISRYVDGLRDLRRGAPSRIVYAPLVGIPTDLQTSTFDTILEDSRMELRLGAGTSLPVPACELMQGENVRTSAGPGARYVEVAKELDLLGSRSVVGSICAESYAPFFGRLLGAISDEIDCE